MLYSDWPADKRLLLMPCSAGKSPIACAAGQAYTGVMWQTLRVHMRRPPHVAILSAKYGFLTRTDEVEPYDLRMTEARASELLEDLDSQVACVVRAIEGCPVQEVFLVGGRTYRAVMTAVVTRLTEGGWLRADARVLSTSGGIGMQRSQLGHYLRAIPG